MQDRGAIYRFSLETNYLFHAGSRIGGASPRSETNQFWTQSLNMSSRAALLKPPPPTFDLFALNQYVLAIITAVYNHDNAPKESHQTCFRHSSSSKFSFCANLVCIKALLIQYRRWTGSQSLD